MGVAHPGTGAADVRTLGMSPFILGRSASADYTSCENVFRIQVNTNIDDWKTTRWKDINVEQMDIDCKKFAKDIRSLDKEMRSWDAFTGLDNSVKNMITSLRAVNELQNPAIRDRHWQELMQATKVLPALCPSLAPTPCPRGSRGLHPSGEARNLF